MKNKKVLILGGDGLIGSCFTYGERVARKDCDLEDYASLLRLLHFEKPDWVINCAGKVGGVQANMDYKMDFFRENMIINLNVIQACMEMQVPNLISFLSTCIFPDEIAKERPLNELDLHNGKPHQSNYPYAYAKRMVDVLSEVAREKGFNYSCLIPTNLYGLNDNYNVSSSHIIPALIHKYYLAYQNSIITKEVENVSIWGSGNPIREFLFAQDIPRIIEYIITNNVRFDNMIIAPPNSQSVKELVELIGNVFHMKYAHTGYADVLPIFDNTKPDGQFKKITDSTKFKELIPIELTPLSNGLFKTIEYFIDKYETNKNLLKL